MKNIRPIPNSVQLFIEIKRLIEAVYTDNTEQFDIFENDMFILFDPVDGIEEEEDEETPNFVHKPTGLKLWWKLGDDVIYSNMPIRYRNLSNIVNQCVASLGRMTEKFIVRYQYWGEAGRGCCYGGCYYTRTMPHYS